MELDRRPHKSGVGMVGRHLVRVLAAALIGALLAAPTRATLVAASPRLAIRVSGNHLVDASGHTIRLLGVNRSGTEYACIQGWGVFDGPSSAASVAAIASWHVNAVRIPLNEACWLGQHLPGWGNEQASTGRAYRDAITSYVRLLNSYGIYAILDLHWSAPDLPGDWASYQHPAPDADYSPAFWSSVAASFRDNSAVIFDLFNEPFWGWDWNCWLKGCLVWPGGKSQYRSAGMQALVEAVRSTGATQPILLGGLQYANLMNGWLSHEPTDPLHQLVASVHLYNQSYPCATTACYSSGPYSLMQLAQKVPIVLGELGEKDCGTSFLDQVMPWADQHGFGYLGWTWDAWANGCRSGPTLITDYGGTPTPYGAGLRAHLAQLALTTTPQVAPAKPPPRSASTHRVSTRPTQGASGSLAATLTQAPGVWVAVLILVAVCASALVWLRRRA